MSFSLFKSRSAQALKFYVDSPVADMINSRICVFSGWALWPRFPERAELRANDIKVDQVLFTRRPDVETAFGYDVAYGWRCFFETSSVISSFGSVKFELFVDGKIIHRSFHRYLPRRDSTFQIAFFQHIPKTAGSSVRMSLENRPDQLNLCSVYNDTPYLPVHYLESFSGSALDDIDVLFGHFTYGAHRFSHRPHRYLSLMRQPVKQVVSYFNFAKYVNKNPDIVDFANLNDALAKSNDISFDNYQTRFIAGYLGSGPVTEDHLSQAIRNIEESYEFVGLTEEFEKSLLSFSEILGVNLISLRKNVNSVALEKNSSIFDPKLLDRATKFDRELYRYVCGKFFTRR